MTSRKKAQAMVEYLMVIAIALLILVPTVIFFSSQTRTVTAEATFAKLDSFGFSLVELIDSMYILGEDSRTTLDINMPQGLQNITVINSTSGAYASGNDVVLEVNLAGIDSQLLYVSTYPFFIGNCSDGVKPFPDSFLETDGRKQFTISSCGGSVAVWYK